MFTEFIERNKTAFVTEAVAEAKRILRNNEHKSCPISLVDLPFQEVPVHIHMHEYFTVQIFEDNYPEHFLNAHFLSVNDYGAFTKDEQGLHNIARFVGAQMAAYNYLLKTPATREKALSIMESLKDGSCPDLQDVLDRPPFDEETALEVLLF